MTNSLQDAIAGVVYRKILACPRRFPRVLRELAEKHYKIWTAKGAFDTVENRMFASKSSSFQQFVETLARYSDRIPDWLAQESPEPTAENESEDKPNSQNE